MINNHDAFVIIFRSILMAFTVEEKIIATSWALAFENNEESRRRFVDRFHKAAPPNRTIAFWKRKLIETGSLEKDRPRSGRPIRASGDDTVADIIHSVNADPTLSTRRLSEECNVSQSTVCRVLKKAKYHPYKPVYSQFLSDGDDDRRREFCETMQQKFKEDPAFYRKLTFSDECLFALNGSVNKHNVHYWGEENPHIRYRNRRKSHNLTVWACIGYNGVVAYDISRQTMNGERYCQILLDKVVPYFTRNADKLFQQDGAAPHYSVGAREILDQRLTDRWIGRRGPIEWPARSPDLTACDFWLWTYLRQKVYVNDRAYNSFDDLQNQIQHELQMIPLHMFRRCMRNFQKRIQSCIRNNGGLFE